MIKNTFYYGIIREDGAKKEEATIGEIERRYRTKMNFEVGRAFYMGKVKALLDEGYNIPEIAKKLDKPESVIRYYKQRIDKKRTKK